MVQFFQLVVPLFGPKDAWERQTMLPLLVRSVAMSNLTLTIIGNAGPRTPLPTNVKHKFVTWSTHVGKFEALAGRDLGMISYEEKKLNAVTKSSLHFHPPRLYFLTVASSVTS